MFYLVGFIVDFILAIYYIYKACLINNVGYFVFGLVFLRLGHCYYYKYWKENEWRRM